MATRTGFVRRALTGFLIMIPLALLALDYVRHPVVWTGCSRMPDVTEDALFASSSVVLGTLLGHRITAALDDIGDSKFLAGSERTPYALVTTEFFQDPLRPEQGMVTRAILERLEQLSPQHYDTLRHQLNNPANLVAGKVVSVALDQPPEQAARFPVSRIYIVMIQYKAGEGAHANDGRIIRAGLKEIMRRANEDRVVGLLVPSLGVNWQEAGWLTHEEFFPMVFESLDTAAGPDLIRLSLYSSTPANVLQRAINAINAAWKGRCAIASGKDVLFEQTTRVVLLFLLVCLVVSAFHAPLTVKNGVVIATAFIGSAAGGVRLLDELIPDYGSPVTRLAVHSCVLGVLALCYPSLVRASAKEIFTEAEKQ